MLGETPPYRAWSPFDVTLTRVVPQHANLELITNPPKARVYIDDLETSYQTPVTIENLKAGRKYTIGLYLKGYRFWTKPVTLKGDETRSFDIQLMRDYGSVSITSNPSKALVIIDGLPVGQTPLVRNDLEPDKVYRIEVWHEGYESESKEIKARTGCRASQNGKTIIDVWNELERRHSNGKTRRPFFNSFYMTNPRLFSLVKRIIVLKK